MKHKWNFKTLSIPVTDMLDTRVEGPCISEAKKSLRVSIVIPASEPSVTMNIENDTASEVSLPKILSSDQDL